MNALRSSPWSRTSGTCQTDQPELIAGLAEQWGHKRAEETHQHEETGGRLHLVFFHNASRLSMR